MATEPVGTALLDESSDRVVAAVVDAAQRATIANHLGEPVAEPPSGLRVVTPVTLVGSYNSRLRKRAFPFPGAFDASTVKSDEHTSALQSLLRSSSAVFCSKTKTHILFRLLLYTQKH